MTRTETAYARIERSGWFLYEITIVEPLNLDGVSPGSGQFCTATSSPWLAVTRRGAERKAARKLRRHLRRKAWREEADRGD